MQGNSISFFFKVTVLIFEVLWKQSDTITKIILQSNRGNISFYESDIKWISVGDKNETILQQISNETKHKNDYISEYENYTISK